jgi:transcription elongation factor Elf1
MAHCPDCSSDNLVTVDMTLNGGPVKFAHCRRCEHRWWTDATDGGALALPQVLHKVTAA